MSKKEIATSFLTMAARGDVHSAYEKFIAPDFRHHNQFYPGDRESLLLGMQTASIQSPNKSLSVKQALEDGDRVVTLSHVVRQDSKAPEIAVVHIFRFEHNRIVELWDFGQLIDPKSPNLNGIF